MDSAWQELTGARFLRALRVATLAITLAVLLLLILPWFPAHAAGYPSYEAQLGAFAVLVAVTVIAGAFLVRSWPLARWRWPLVGLVLLVAVVAMVGTPPARLGGDLGWTIRCVGWVVLLLLLDDSVMAVGVVLAAHLLLVLGYLVASGQGRPAVLAELAMANVLPLVFQLAVATAAHMLRRTSVTAALVADEEEEVRTAEAVAEQLHRDRSDRYAQARISAVPLLDGLASGQLDPDDEQVRTRCAIEAARMRRLFAENDDVHDPLVHELHSCLDWAERRGLAVHLVVRGRCPPLEKEVRRALTEPVIAVLATARSRSRARVTVEASERSVAVNVLADAESPAVPVPDAAGVAVSPMEHNGRVWVESRWDLRNP